MDELTLDDDGYLDMDQFDDEPLRFVERRTADRLLGQGSVVGLLDSWKDQVVDISDGIERTSAHESVTARDRVVAMPRLARLAPTRIGLTRPALIAAAAIVVVIFGAAVLISSGPSGSPEGNGFAVAPETTSSTPDPHGSTTAGPTTAVPSGLLPDFLADTVPATASIPAPESGEPCPKDATCSFATVPPSGPPANILLPEGYANYMSVMDDSATITFDVPVEWADLDGSELADFGPSLWASPNLAQFIETWASPGIRADLTTERDEAHTHFRDRSDVLRASCLDAGDVDFSTDGLTGTLRAWTDCGGRETTVLLVAVTTVSPLPAYIIVEVHAIQQADLEAAERAFETLTVGSL